jgi:hypothetical protein
MAVLHDLLDALKWCEQHYVTLQAEPTGYWILTAADRRTEQDVTINPCKEEDDYDPGFLVAYEVLRGKLE